MKRWHRWAAMYLGGTAALLVAYAVAYNVGMATVENDPQSFVRSLEVVLVHFATVGYASELPQSGAMTALVALVSVTGQVFVLAGLVGVVVGAARELSSSKTRT